MLEQVWAEDAVIEHHGTHWTIPKAIMNPKPVQRPRPPVLLGGFSQATLERVGRRADGWLAGGLPLPLLTQMWRAVLQRAEAAGRDPQALRLVVRVNPVLTAEPAPEAEVPRRGTVGQLVGYLSGVVEALDAEVLLDLHFAAGDPEEYLALAAGLHDALRERAS